MKKNNFSLYFIFISFFTLSTVFVYLVQKSYFNLLEPQNQVKNNALLKTINPDLDLSVMSEIESRNKNTEDNFDFSILNPKPTLEPTLEPTLKPTLKPTLEPTLEQSSTSSDQTNTDETLNQNP